MAEDAIKVAPQAYKLVLENQRVRVLEYRGGPGTRAAMHSHPDLAAVAIRGGKVKFTSPDGQSAEAELQDGQVMFFDATEHATENVGTTDIHILLVELK